MTTEPTLSAAESGPFAAGLSRRLAELAESQAYAAYLEVRDHVLRMKALEAERAEGAADPSAYWSEELENIEYLLDASPLIVDRLRHHCFHITGIRVYEYRSNRDESARKLKNKLDALLQVGRPELLIPESRALGGFGFEIDGELYNVDTLKFFESLIALDRGGVIADLRSATGRPVVWEIGAGWGGLAFQIKTVCPHVTYAICDFPELFLYSATYLKALFPDARCAFYGQDDFQEAVDAGADFVFFPNTVAEQFRPPRLDLTVNTVSFQEMTGEQVDAYVRQSHALGGRYLYSLNRDRSPYNPEIASVSELIGRCYWPHEIAVLPMAYTRLLGKPPSPELLMKPPPPKTDLDYRHIVGWRRAEPAPA